jgi:uncharacterized membrane protein YqjE
MNMSDRSFSDVLQDVVRNIQEIVRSEVRLAKTEIGEEAVKAKAAAIFVGIGAVCGLFAGVFFLLAVLYALIRVVPDWSAALILAAIMAGVAVVALNAGVKQFKRVHPAPDKTIDSLKENVAWAKEQTK